jgi:hypothetical protein
MEKREGGKEKGKGKEESKEAIRMEIQRLQSLLPPPGVGNPGPAPNLGPYPASQSERRHGKGEVHGRTDTFLDEKVEVRSGRTVRVRDTNVNNPLAGEAKDFGSRGVLADASERD